jgi:8-oxo-dGTP pyrophosphatase MutT (NUDIX family)
MWIVTTEGFFSIVQKPGEEQLSVRARSAADLDSLRARMPALGPTVVGAGTDYPVRARASREAMAQGLADLVRDVDYSNFKSAVAVRVGKRRAEIYGSVWSDLLAIASEPTPSPAPVPRRAPLSETPPEGLRPAFGGVVIRGGDVLLRRPTGDYDGYVWTFPKGRPAPSDTPEQTALREVREETGVVTEIVGALPGWFQGGTTATRFFVMRPVQETGVLDRETQQTAWVPLTEADAWVAQTRNATGRARDLAVLAEARAWLAAR